MQKAIVLTASRGLGLKLAEHSLSYNIQSQTIGITKKGVGESVDLPAYKTDFLIDIDNSSITELPTTTYNYLVWNTGVFLQKSFSDMLDNDIDVLIDLHYRTPLQIIRKLHNNQQNPYHFIVIASCSSWRIRSNESVYCGLCAAKAAFTRNFANDLSRELPGSKVTLINPGGLRTPFFHEDKEVEDIHNYLNQDELALFIWQTALEQKKGFQEIQYLRNKTTGGNDKLPIIEYGQRMPETI